MVVDDQHPAAVERGEAGLFLARLFLPDRRFRGFGGVHDHLDGEDRTQAFLALDTDLAAHHLDQTTGDVEPQSRTAEIAGGRGVGLGEGAEQLGHRGLVHADPGVGHPQPHPHPAIGLGIAGQSDLDLAVGGELQGVGNQVRQALAHPHAVEQERARGLALQPE